MSEDAQSGSESGRISKLLSWARFFAFAIFMGMAFLGLMSAAGYILYQAFPFIEPRYELTRRGFELALVTMAIGFFGSLVLLLLPGVTRGVKHHY